jgi:hypothetical protein
LWFIGVITVITYRKDPTAVMAGWAATALGAGLLLLPPLYRIVRDQLRLAPRMRSDAAGTTNDVAHDRILISRTSEEIWKEFVDRTDFETQQLVKRFVGKWWDDNQTFRSIMMFFNEKRAIDRLVLMRRGEHDSGLGSYPRKSMIPGQYRNSGSCFPISQFS